MQRRICGGNRHRWSTQGSEMNMPIRRSGEDGTPIDGGAKERHHRGEGEKCDLEVHVPSPEGRPAHEVVAGHPLGLSARG